MRSLSKLFAIRFGLLLMTGHAFSETSDMMEPEALLALAPRISMEEKTISSFEVKGTLDFDGIRLRFIVSGQRPDRLAIRILDPRDETPILLAVGESTMLYDPIDSEVLLGRASATFTLSVEKDPEDANENNPDGQSVMLGFGFASIGENKNEAGDEDEPETTLIDIQSFLDSLVKPLKVTSEDNQSFVLSGLTKRGNRAEAHISPLREEGPYTRLELYQLGKSEPFLVLDEIVLNQALSESRFVFPAEQLEASSLRTKRMSTDGLSETVLSTGRLVRAIMTRLILAGVDEPEIKSALERMSKRTLDWEALKQEDEKAGTVLRSIFKTM